MTEIVTLDVRPLLAQGKEPLAAIMQAADGSGYRLLLRRG